MNVELMLWIILGLWLFQGILSIIVGIALDGEPKEHSALGGIIDGTVSILLVVIILAL